jgi:hypothetical protein
VITIWECGLRANSQQSVFLAAELLRHASSGSAWEIRQAPNQQSECTVIGCASGSQVSS